MRLVTESYLNQISRWPQTGRHILAQYDGQTVVVYQAYRPEIGHFAASNGYFGGEFSLERMSWIKPNFLWMMYRCGWGTKDGQEVVLAIWIQRSAFEEILRQAVHSSFVPELYPSKSEWQKVLKHSQVRLQWDPDHHPSGEKLERRAIQLGLRGQVLAAYAKDWIVKIEDISDFVKQQRQNLNFDYTELITPQEKVYPVFDSEIQQKLRLSAWTE
ncbi:DUF4291 domain-containing protein [Nostoc spongiaeforme FACHB-130]|uniref:DUF4291 domain-containing protein n=1 Tax=Nostoc spongiaeforme FACHB-130 TaxID=1357510 RepID=A0ABR8G0P8_9NOSO|nr:DUF4291 domain-containing protein [Nostoc spongiaeforme]MBD2596805.1 DUF4291 domain-containing protein [Nostoc spongiaeforme FACHB-130]